MFGAIAGGIASALSGGAVSTFFESYTLSLHDALPISPGTPRGSGRAYRPRRCRGGRWNRDRKSTRLNSSHTVISYAVFCLKKKNATKCRGLVSLNQVIKEIICLQPLK